MKKFHKHIIDLKNFSTEITLPKGSQFLSIQNENNKICLYFLVDVNTKETQVRTFEVFYTGELISDKNDYLYVGTVKMESNIILHVFEITKVNKN